MSSTPAGRFAPTPSGSLHFGSLIAALASYLNIKHQDGRWYVRIDDIDTPRIAKNAINEILNTLEFLAFEWDGDVYFQSEHLDDYQQALSDLQQQKLIFKCICTRNQVGGNIYSGKCRTLNSEIKQSHSLRIKTDNSNITVNDMIQGAYTQNLTNEVGDFIVFRRDNIFSYHLSTVIDDANQNITEIVRGFDLLESTPRQVFLRKKLKLNNPSYFHFPVATCKDHKKLSKQSFAKPLEKQHAATDLVKALHFLGQKPDSSLCRSTPEEILSWAIENWNMDTIPKLLENAVS